MLGGVAGGIAQTYGFDPALVRIVIAAAMVFTVGTAFAAYVVAWIVIPEDDGRALADDFKTRARHHRRDRHRLPWIGIGLVIAGLFALGDTWHPGPARVLGPLALLAAGAAILLYRHDRDATEVVPPYAPTSPTPPAASASASVDVDPDDAADVGDVSTASAATDTTDEVSAVDTTATTRSAYETQSWPATPTPPIPPALPRLPRRPRERSILGRLTLSALLLLAGVAWMADLTGATQVNPGFVLALALGIVGAALVAGAWFGRALGLIGLGVVLTAACCVVAAINVPLRGGIGAHTYRPATAADVRSRYELAIGNLVVDLSQLPADSPRQHITVRNGVGQARITVPYDADVTVHARVDAGHLSLFDQPGDGGWHARDTVHVVGTGVHIDIDAQVGFGQVKVERGFAPFPNDFGTPTTTFTTPTTALEVTP
jgi:phage shock protein PspC (stress-responsive transcriptional regulator)